MTEHRHVLFTFKLAQSIVSTIKRQTLICLYKLYTKQFSNFLNSQKVTLLKVNKCRNSISQKFQKTLLTSLKFCILNCLNCFESSCNLVVLTKT